MSFSLEFYIVILASATLPGITMSLYYCAKHLKTIAESLEFIREKGVAVTEEQE